MIPLIKIQFCNGNPATTTGPFRLVGAALLGRKGLARA